MQFRLEPPEPDLGYVLPSVVQGFKGIVGTPARSQAVSLLGVSWVLNAVVWEAGLTPAVVWVFSTTSVLAGAPLPGDFHGPQLVPTLFQLLFYLQGLRVKKKHVPAFPTVLNTVERAAGLDFC